MAQPKNAKVLIIDDDANIVSSLERMLRLEKYETAGISDPALAVAKVNEWFPDVILLDVRMPISGLDLLREFDLMGIDAQTIVMTGHGTVDMAVQAVKDGAFDFISKPFEMPETLFLKIQKALEYRRLLRRTRELESAVPAAIPTISGTSRPMEELKRTIVKIAPSNGTVLITGETGVGKEMVARAIHQNSTRAQKPFLAVNCSALSEQLIESELFGHEKGSFTGAMNRRDGLFIEADRGVLFLDEIGEMPLALQAKLLRVLQEGEVRRVGSNHTVKVDIRLIAATNRDLPAQIAKGEFREDLYYRLNVINLHIQPLRLRKEDVAVLASRFVEKHQADIAADQRVRLSPKTLEILERYSWPGNVRELENVIQRALILSDGQMILPRELPAHMLERIETKGRTFSLRVELPYQEAKHQFLEDFDRDYVECLLEQCEGSLSKAAQLAGMDRSNFRKLVIKTGAKYLDKPESAAVEEAV